MGFLDRIRGRADGTAPGDSPPEPPDGPASDSTLEGVEPVEEITVRALSASEEARLAAARGAYAEHGIDPPDLGTVAAAYERALDTHGDEDASAVIEVLATAMGDHLVTAGGYRWVVTSDPFGTDLAVEPPRRGVPVVTRMLVAVRWMARERDWLTGVTEHLVRIGRS